MDTQLKADLIEALMIEIKKETKKINDNINDKHKKLEDKLANVEKKLKTVEETAINALKQTDINHTRIAETNETLDEQKQAITSLKEALIEQTDRSLRSTLIFKGIPREKNEKSWDDTKNVLVEYLSNTFNWDPNGLNNDIECTHRGKFSEENRNNKKHNEIPIYIHT